MLTSPPDAGSRPRTSAPRPRPSTRPSQSASRPSPQQLSAIGGGLNDSDDLFDGELLPESTHSFLSDWRHERSIRRSLRFANKTMPESLRPPSVRRSANQGVTTFRSEGRRGDRPTGPLGGVGRPKSRPDSVRSSRVDGSSASARSTNPRSVASSDLSGPSVVRTSSVARTSTGPAASSARSSSFGRGTSSSTSASGSIDPRVGRTESARSPIVGRTTADPMTNGALALATAPRSVGRTNRQEAAKGAPRPQLRSVERPVSSIFRSKGFRRLVFLMLLVGGFAIATASIVMHASLARNQLKLDRQRQEVAVAEQQNLQLRATVAELEAPYRIVSVAESLGLQQPYDIQYVVAKPATSSSSATRK